MMHKPWFKIFIWFISTVFFLSASFCLIAELGPNVSEQQSMAYMSGMMNAMHNSLMGLSMSIENDSYLKKLISEVSAITLPLIFIGFAAGMLTRVFKRSRNNG